MFLIVAEGMETVPPINSKMLILMVGDVKEAVPRRTTRSQVIPARWLVNGAFVSTETEEVSCALNFAEPPRKVKATLVYLFRSQIKYYISNKNKQIQKQMRV